MALITLADYKGAARTLLQDTFAGDAGAGYRYSDASLEEGLNLAVAEIARLRPDLMFKALRTGIPRYFDDADVVAVSRRYSASITMFMVGWAQLRDQEDAQDQRAGALLSKFSQQLVGAPNG